MIKDIWTIEIGSQLYQLMPGFFQQSHIDKRNQHVGKFQGLNLESSPASLLEILILHDAKYAYRKPNDPHFYAQFAKESDLLEACSGSFYKGNLKIIGTPKDITWMNRQQFLEENRGSRRMSPALTAKNGLSNKVISPINTYNHVPNTSLPSHHQLSPKSQINPYENKSPNYNTKGKAVSKAYIPNHNIRPVATGTNLTPLNNTRRKFNNTHRSINCIHFKQHHQLPRVNGRCC